MYLYNYGGTGFGWMLDDVKVKVSSDVHSADKNETMDNWNLVTTTDYQGQSTTAWFSGDPLNHGGDFKDGVDNSLYTRPIDLTNARTAILDGMFKFNIEEAPGRPPDGFRVEVSSNNGVSWIPLSLGVRTAWGVSGTDADADDNVIGDGKSFTGIDAGDNWVPVGSLTRLITNLNGFIGNTIILRFRVISNTDGQHYEDGNYDMGFYVDDIKIYGESLEGTRSQDEGILTEYLNRVKETETPVEKGETREYRSNEVDESISPVTEEIDNEQVVDKGYSIPLWVSMVALVAAERILRELLKMDPENKHTGRFYRKCRLKARPQLLNKVRAGSVFLFLLSALIISIEVLFVRPWYAIYVDLVEQTRNSLFFLGCLGLLAGFGLNFYLAHRDLIAFRRQAAQ
jgi:hypothetical protein